MTANDLRLSPKLRKIYNVSDDGELHMENFLAREYKKFISLTEPYFHPWNYTEGEGAHLVDTPCIYLIHCYICFDSHVWNLNAYAFNNFLLSSQFRWVYMAEFACACSINTYVWMHVFKISTHVFEPAYGSYTMHMFNFLLYMFQLPIHMF